MSERFHFKGIGTDTKMHHFHDIIDWAIYNTHYDSSMPDIDTKTVHMLNVWPDTIEGISSPDCMSGLMDTENYGVALQLTVVQDIPYFGSQVFDMIIREPDLDEGVSSNEIWDFLDAKYKDKVLHLLMEASGLYYYLTKDLDHDILHNE